MKFSCSKVSYLNFKLYNIDKSTLSIESEERRYI